MTEDTTTVLHPQPRRPYDLTPTSTDSSFSTPTTPSRDFSQQTSDSSRMEVDPMPESRNRSILNLTSSTLFGIYTPSASSIEMNRDQSWTPSGNGSRTRGHSIDDNKPPIIGAYERPQPESSHSHHPHQSFLETFLPLGIRTILLFSFGVAYGVIVSHLHDHQQVAPVQLEGIEQSSWVYLMAWGGVGILFGGLLPWIDALWGKILGGDKKAFASRSKYSRPAGTSKDQSPRSASNSVNGLGADWNPIVRSVGAFIGIAFAIRRLPWQSTSQVSLTLALVNPVLWYLVDRSKPGFLLSTVVGLAGTAIAFGIYPGMVPLPAAPSPNANPENMSHVNGIYIGVVSNESIGVGIWIASVLFCSCVCFGNIGRRLAGAPNGRSSVLT